MRTLILMCLNNGPNEAFKIADYVKNGGSRRKSIASLTECSNVIAELRKLEEEGKVERVPGTSKWKLA